MEIRCSSRRRPWSMTKKRVSLKNFSIPIRIPTLVGMTGFEPAALWSQTRCATKLRYIPNARYFFIALVL